MKKADDEIVGIKGITIAPDGDGKVEICWTPQWKNRSVSICFSESPDGLTTIPPVMSVKDGGCVELDGLESGHRYYFRVVPEGGRGMTAAERRVPLDGAVNFRDLGGYEAKDGRRVKWGHVFRSDNLARLSERDQALLTQMGIKVVCDFRTEAEAQMGPDRLPESGSIAYVRLPVTHGAIDSVAALERIRKGDAAWLTPDFMVEGYIRNIDAYAAVWGTVINRLADAESRPLLFHCTGGKDRAGVCAALVLLALGVPEETVVYDHGLSNVFIRETIQKLYGLVKSMGLDPDKLAPYFTAPRECIDAALGHIRDDYGSPENYLTKKAGVTAEALGILRDELLE